MFNRIRSSAIWASMLREYKRENYEEASALADRYRSIAFENAAFRALDATLDVLNKNSDRASEKFRKLSSYLADIKKSDSTYIKAYADYYISLIERRPESEDIRQHALALPASRNIKSWLRLPNERIEL